MRREEEWKGEGEEDEEGSTEDGEGEGEDMDCEVEKEMGRTRFLTQHNTTKRYCPARAARGCKRAALANEGKGPLAGVGGRNRPTARSGAGGLCRAGNQRNESTAAASIRAAQSLSQTPVKRAGQMRL